MNVTGPDWGVQPDDINNRYGSTPPGRKRQTISSTLGLTPQPCTHVRSIADMGKGPLERKLKFERKNKDLLKLPKRENLTQPLTISTRDSQ